MIILGNSRLYLGGKLLAVAKELGMAVESIKKDTGVRGFGVRGFDYSTIIIDDLISSADSVKNNKHYRDNDQNWKGKGKRRKMMIK